MRQLGRASWIALTLASAAAFAQNLPEGHGRAETLKFCTQCHELARSISPRQDREGWNQTLTKMTAFGMRTKQDEYAAMLEYLAKQYPAEDVPRVNVNTARAIDLEATLSLRRSQARQVLEYREKHGAFKSLADLKKVPSLDAAKLDEKRDRILFQ